MGGGEGQKHFVLLIFVQIKPYKTYITAQYSDERSAKKEIKWEKYVRVLSSSELGACKPISLVQ
jgi:hypothetical protein